MILGLFLARLTLRLFIFCPSAAAADAPLEVVPQVDLARYAGTWYEIARFPQYFQKGCTNSKAVYTPLPDGRIEVLNSCSRDNKVDSVKGKAWVGDKATNAKLKVSFFWFLRGDYWIIELGREYDYAVVSAPGRKYLWVLCRTPRMNELLYGLIVDRLKEKGFDTAKLHRTLQEAR